MDSRSLLTIAVSGVVGLAALGGAGSLATPINAQRDDLQLSLAKIEQTLPPDAALTQAFLGTFRGLAVNVLWQRAENLKNEGKFFEAMQLADWITTLQPRYPKVWEFTSWNKAYNISVATYTPEERWMWVKQGGIDELRDKGIFYNPNSLTLYKQLAWIFLHKVGEFMDDQHSYYKRQMAIEWDTILGGGPPVTADFEDMGEYVAWLTPVAEAPETLAELYERQPGTRRLVDHLRGRGYRLTDEGVGPNLLPDFAYEYSDFHPEDESEPHFHLEGAGTGEEGIGAVTYAAWPEWAEDEDKQAVLAFARRKVITGSPIRMDPAKMIADAERFGPLDWRHQASHGIYWTMRGLEQGEAVYGKNKGEDLYNTRRNLLVALQQLQRSGRVQFEPQTRGNRQVQDLRFYPAYEREFDRAMLDFSEGDVVTEEGRELAERLYGVGYRNNVDQIVSQLYLFGDEDEATEIFERVRARYSGTEHEPRYAVPIERYVRLHLDENFENPDQARSAVINRTGLAIVQGYGEGDSDAAENLLAQARRGHAWFINEFDGAGGSGQEMPQDFDDIILAALVQVMASPPGFYPPMTKIAVWDNIENEHKQRAWPIVYPALARETEQYGYDLPTAYPAPAGSPEVPVDLDAQPDPAQPRIERQ